jgi:hypothetical protein
LDTGVMEGSHVPTLRGQYTVAAHFHDMIRQIGSKVTFQVSLRKMKFKESTSGSVLVNILQRVKILDCHQGSNTTLGSYEENLVAEVTGIDELVPGKDFRFLSMEMRWTKPLSRGNRPHSTSGSMTVPSSSSQRGHGGCRTQ